MPLQATTIMLGVQDLARAKRFYGDGLGCTIDQDQPGFVSFTLGGGPSLALYPWEAAARDAGVPPAGSGFRGVSFHYVVDSGEAVHQVLKDVTEAGGTIVREAVDAPWGCSGYFSDPDGYLWKVAAAA
ncbi:VOC family protein [Cryptosporangium arvum]|uniref:Lactoylglutathione lyase-like lyase n=1 Tax=Cryptosporangium arvum DSM 44712 TaxID=927661 RepID=A0A010ZUQ6_9ACTN|nr:VOC family protein [Cryptosporangium arvum]EXG82429.1 lactoylglutathione lyase-like lyase [Cryptosporangium arvum DSM 44712]